MSNCIYCGRPIKPPKKKFCCNKHKDKYHNEHNPRGMFVHLHPDRIEIDEDHPFSGDGIGQWID